MAGKKSLPTREQADAAFLWHTQDIFESDEQFLKALERLKECAGQLSAFQGKLGDAKTLLRCLQMMEQTEELAGNVGSYAALKSDQDTANPLYQGYVGRVSSVGVELSAATAYFTPEILALGDRVGDMEKACPELALYRKYLDDILRQKAHILPEREERLLSLTGEMAGAAEETFSMLNDADMRFGEITGEDGEPVTLTHGRYIHFLESTDRRVRKEAFETLYRAYEQHSNTLASLLCAHERKNKFYKQARGYKSCLEMCLFSGDIPESVYHSLIEAVHGAFPAFYDYMALRRRALGLEQLHMYDLYVPVTENPYQGITYEQAFELVFKALAPLGEEYVSLLHRARDEGWIDVYENEGKRGGAYSWGSYGVHPFVLLNHNDTVNSMFTLAHEMGHALHSWFTWQTQPYLYSGHKIFVAEVASTCNEALLMEYLLNTTKDQNMRKYLVNYYLEQFRGTLFRQTMFAEFEKITHEMVENGEPLTWENMNQIYHDLNRLYFGDDIVIDPQIDIEWARIPHFYNAFYVYQYATGYSAAIALSRKILTEGQPAIDAYLDFLSKGDSEYSIDLLIGAGVDMSKKDAIESAMVGFERLLDEMEQFNN